MKRATLGSSMRVLTSPEIHHLKVCAAISKECLVGRLPYLVAVNKNAQDVDLVNQGLDGGPAANAEAKDKVVGDTQAVEEQDRVPASSPAAMHGKNTRSFYRTQTK